VLTVNQKIDISNNLNPNRIIGISINEKPKIQDLYLKDICLLKMVTIKTKADKTGIVNFTHSTLLVANDK
jgi:hypothetical protein